jgi:HlyD family secretion protein
MKFRFKALQRMREPDELDSPTLLAAPRGWIAVFVLMIIMGSAVAWSFLGSLPITVTAAGLLTRPGGTASVQSPYSGMVRRLTVQASQTVTAGTPVAQIQDATGRLDEVTSPFSGHVVSLAVAAGQVVQAGATLVTVESTSGHNDRVVAMIFVPSDSSVALAPGDPVGLSVSTAPSAAFGLLRGRVSSVSTYPLTFGALSGLVGGDLAARRYSSISAPRLVVVDLLRDRATRSGYAWSTTTGPPMPLSTQVSVSATIQLGSQTPFSLVLGR